jgi:hypothetical protein
MSEKPHNNGHFPWRAAALVGAMGINVAVCLVGGYWLGDWMAGRWGGHPLAWKAGGFVAGLAVAAWSVVRLVQKALGDADE